MIDKSLPSINEVKKRYQIRFDNYSIVILHPIVNIDKKKFYNQVKIFFSSIIKSKRKYIIIYPNNDVNSEIVLRK